MHRGTATMSHINSHSNYINLFAVTLLMVVSNPAAADTIATKPLYLENDNAIDDIDSKLEELQKELLK